MLVIIDLFFAAILKICDIYDWDGKGELDMFFLGDVIYACGLNTTKKVGTNVLYDVVFTMCDKQYCNVNIRSVLVWE